MIKSYKVKDTKQSNKKTLEAFAKCEGLSSFFLYVAAVKGGERIGIHHDFDILNATYKRKKIFHFKSPPSSFEDFQDEVHRLRVDMKREKNLAALCKNGFDIKAGKTNSLSGTKTVFEPIFEEMTDKERRAYDVFLSKVGDDTIFKTKEKR